MVLITNRFCAYWRIERRRSVLPVLYPLVLTLGLLVAFPAAGASEVQLAQIPDADGDGVADTLDRCDGHIPGTSGLDSQGCPEQMSDIYAGLLFDDADHREWYERYWRNDCRGLSFWQRIVCQNDADYWFRTIADFVARVRPEDRSAVRFRLWRFGRYIGHEWAKDNDVRKIHTSDIQSWGNMLENSVELEMTLRLIEDRARSRMNN